MTSIAKVSVKGQITIPADVRKRLDIDEGDTVLFELTDTSEVVSMKVIKHKLPSEFRGIFASRSKFPGKERLRKKIREDIARRIAQE